MNKKFAKYAIYLLILFSLFLGYRVFTSPESEIVSRGLLFIICLFTLIWYIRDYRHE